MKTNYEIEHLSTEMDFTHETSGRVALSSHSAKIAIYLDVNCLEEDGQLARRKMNEVLEAVEWLIRNKATEAD